MQNVTHLVRNPNFEQPFIQHDNGPIFVAEHWLPFWTLRMPPQEEAQGPCARPEFKPIDKVTFPYRVHDGDHAQCFFSYHKVMDAGVYQQVEVDQGSIHQFSLFGHGWSTNTNDPNLHDGEMYITLGIDPWGRVDPWERGVIWTNWMWLGPQYVEFRSVPTTANSTKITLFVEVWNKWRLQHNDAYLDSVTLHELDQDIIIDPPPVEGCGFDIAMVRNVVREEVQAALNDTKLHIPFSST